MGGHRIALKALCREIEDSLLTAERMVGMNKSNSWFLRVQMEQLNTKMEKKKRPAGSSRIV